MPDLSSPPCHVMSSKSRAIRHVHVLISFHDLAINPTKVHPHWPSLTQVQVRWSIDRDPARSDIRSGGSELAITPYTCMISYLRYWNLLMLGHVTSMMRSRYQGVISAAGGIEQDPTLEQDSDSGEYLFTVISPSGGDPIGWHLFLVSLFTRHGFR